MKRKTALDLMRFAGYHEDKQVFTALVIGNRISMEKANEAYRLGIKMKKAGMKCDCWECKKC